MRPLHRPMFRYGGPIKEGVMSGIREPKKGGGAMGNQALLVGNPAFPMQGGRRMHAEQLSLFDVLKKSAGQTFTGMKKEPIKTILPGKKVKGVVGILSNLSNRLKNYYRTGVSKLDMPPRFKGAGPEFKGAGTAGGGSIPLSVLEKIKYFGRKNPKTTIAGAYLGSGPAYDVATGSVPLVKRAALQVADLAVPDFIFDQDQYFADKAAKEKLEKKETDTTIVEDSPVVIPQKSAEQIRNERIQKYRDIMDIKGMNQRAAYDSLIDASKLVGESGDFKGDIKSGKLINEIIQATSKQFDKPAKTKDAIDTLILKGEIEADIAAGKPSTYLKTAQDMVATGAAKNIQEAMKLLTKSSSNMATTLGAIVAKDGRVDEEKVGIAYRGETGNIPKGMIKVSEVNEWKENNPGKDELDYTKELIEKTEIAPGDYVIGKRVVTVDKNKGVSFFY